MASKYLGVTSGSVTWSTATNWSDLVTPVSSDTVTIGGSTATIDYALNQAAVTLTSLSVPMTFTGTAGYGPQTPISITGITRSSTTATATTAAVHGYVANDTVIVSGADQADYNITATILSAPTTTTFTYTVANSPTTPATTSSAFSVRRGDKLIIGATALTFGLPGTGATPATGSGRFNVDLSSIQSAVTVIKTASRGTDDNLEPLRIVGTHTSNTYVGEGGLVGLGTSIPGETVKFLTITVTGGTTNCGTGLTWTQVNQTGGTLSLNCGSASTSSYIAQGGGTMRLTGAGVVANATFAGTVTFDLRKASAGDTVTGTLQLMSGAVLDLTNNPAAISVATLRLSGSNITIRRNKATPGSLSWTTLTQDVGSSVSFE